MPMVKLHPHGPSNPTAQVCGHSLPVVKILSGDWSYVVNIENTSWKVLAYGIYARVVDVSEIERVSAANE